MQGYLILHYGNKGNHKIIKQCIGIRQNPYPEFNLLNIRQALARIATNFPIGGKHQHS